MVPRSTPCWHFSYITRARSTLGVSPYLAGDEAALGFVCSVHRHYLLLVAVVVHIVWVRLELGVRECASLNASNHFQLSVREGHLGQVTGRDKKKERKVGGDGGRKNDGSLAANLDPFDAAANAVEANALNDMRMILARIP